MIGPTALDLVTLSEAVEWIFGAPQNVGQNTAVLQSLISSLSLDFLRRTGRASQNGSVPAQSPFNQAVAYSESYSGNGNNLLQIRNWPILSVSAVTIYGNAVPESTSPNSLGWFIEDSGQFLGLRLGGSMNAGYGGYRGGGWAGLRGAGVGAKAGGWPKGIDCIQVSYTAGFAARSIVGELQTIPVLPPTWQANHAYGSGAQIFDGTNIQTCSIVAGNATVANSGTPTPQWGAKAGVVAADGAYLAWTCQGAPYIVMVNQLPWLSDVGVSYFSSGNPLAPVSIAPGAGQYYALGFGSYLFNSSDAGKQVLMSYDAAGTPADIQETMLRWVNLIYKRRGWEGIRSLMQKDAGSTTYTSFEIDPSFEKTFRYYRRRA
jgi:hypothetical protein